MKDFYLQLGIDPNASKEAIEEALRAKPEASDAASILLNDSRRAAYNRTVSTLRSIGMLRHRLGLDTGPSWFGKTCPDFSPHLTVRKYVPPTPPASEPAANARVPDQIPAAGSRNYKPWIRAAVIIFAVAVVLALLRVFL